MRANAGPNDRHPRNRSHPPRNAQIAVFVLSNARRGSYKVAMGSRANRHAFVIHGIDHARAVLTAASGTGAMVALWSAPGAGATMGAPMFREIIAAASAEFPGSDAIGVLDCGRDAGFALAAIRHGVKFVRVEGLSATLAKVTDIARQMGATVVHQRPPALDLAECPEPFAACRSWLSGIGH